MRANLNRQSQQNASRSTVFNTFEEMTWTEVREAASKNSILVLPVAAIEQHGPHLPLSTDVIQTYEIAKAVAIKANAVVAPPIRYGCYSTPKWGGGEGFPGTTGISAVTFLNTLREIMKEFIRQGFRRFLVLNGHSENVVLPEAVSIAVEESGISSIKAVIMSWGDVLTDAFYSKFYGEEISKGLTFNKDHAAICETSLIMYLRSDLVRSDKIPDDRIKRNVNYDIIPTPSDTITEGGNLWSARLASKEKGRLIFDASVEGLLKVIAEDL